VNTALAPGTSGTLVLAEAAGSWSATLDGRPLAKLAAPVDGWAQGFTLPAGGGALVVTRSETARNVSLGVEAAALLIALVLALPGSRSSAPASAAEAVPSAEGAGEPRAEGARKRSAESARKRSAEGARERRAAGARPARRQARPQPAMAGVTAVGGARAGEGDDIGVGYPVAAGAVDDDPFGTHDDPGYDADEEPAPWAGLAQQIPQTPALKDRPDRPEPDPDPAPAAPRRSRGQHAARHGKPSRRSRGQG
jgi:hypothetical protein